MELTLGKLAKEYKQMEAENKRLRSALERLKINHFEEQLEVCPICGICPKNVNAFIEQALLEGAV